MSQLSKWITSFDSRNWPQWKAFHDEFRYLSGRECWAEIQTLNHAARVPDLRCQYKEFIQLSMIDCVISYLTTFEKSNDDYIIMISMWYAIHFDDIIMLVMKTHIDTTSFIVSFFPKLYGYRPIITCKHVQMSTDLSLRLHSCTKLGPLPSNP